jgi:hypothetical protein
LETFIVVAKERMDGSFAPGVKLRAAIRCLTVAMTLAVSVSPSVSIA